MKHVTEDILFTWNEDKEIELLKLRKKNKKYFFWTTFLFLMNVVLLLLIFLNIL